MKLKSKNTSRAISMTLAALMLVVPVNVVLAASTDIQGHWAEKTITEWQAKGLIGGYQDGTFKPDKPATRAEFARIMNQALGLSSKGIVAFSDVIPSDWFYNDVAIALGEEYTAGYPDGTFKPNETITRAQAAIFIANAIEAAGGSITAFTDADDIPAWAKDSVGAIVAKGYMSGYPDGTFKPNAVLTRAEAVSTLNRIMGTVTEQTTVTEKDVVIDLDDTKLENQTVAGNVIISEKVGDGEVYLSNVEIKGDLIVHGGGDHSVYADSVVVKGKALLDKKNVRFQVSGKTEISKLEIKQACNLQEKNFTGEVKAISVAAPVSDKITIGLNAGELIVQNKSTLVINKNIEKIVIENGANDTKLEIEKGAKIGTVTADAKLAITGSGTVAKLEAHVDGITVAPSTAVTKTDTAPGVTEPTKPAVSGGGGGGGGSTSPTVSQYDLVFNYYRNDVITKTAVRTFNGTDAVSKALIYQFYDDNKDAIKTQLVGADGLITKILSLESDSNTNYAQSMALKILNYSGVDPLKVVNKQNNEALLIKIRNGIASNADIEQLADIIADASLADIESDILTLYGAKTKSDLNLSGLAISLWSAAAEADMNSKTLSTLSSEFLADAGTISQYDTKTLLSIELGTTKLVVSVRKV
ncbi:MAG: S-layer homology domain-containing protein [Lachnospiraceae bacterium]|nr:S-layer homology domain-containing protein [Lachnospiraceae bacterium]